MEKLNSSNKNIAGISLWKKLTSLNEIGLIIGLVALIVMFSSVSPVFFTLDNIINVIRQISILGIMSIGMTMVIVVGEIDLSVGSTYGMTAMLTAVLMSMGLSIVLSVVIALSVGVLVGLANGVLSTYFRIPSLIATLGMLNVIRGASLMMTGGLPIALTERVTQDPGLPNFLFLGSGKLLGIIPSLVIAFIIICFVGYLIYRKTILGFHMRAVGGNAAAAIVAGINARKVKIIAFAILGLLSAFGGILNFAFLANVQGTMGEGLELNVIAATIIGGASLKGGEGSILGTILGVLIIGILRNGLILIGVSAFLQITLIGVIIIGAVAIDMWTNKR